jgi:hypothetical protein
LNAEPEALAALPGVFGADALPHVWLGCPVTWDGPRVVALDCVVVVLADDMLVPGAAAV